MKRFLWLFLVLCISAWPARAAGYKFLEDDAEAQVSIAFTARTAPGGSLSLVFDFRDNQNFYALEMTPGKVQLKSTVAGRVRVLDAASLAWKPQAQVTLKRRPWLMEVIVERRVLLTAYDATFTSGKIGSLAAGGWGLIDPHVQPVAEIYFGDDFTRTAEQQSAWKAAGKWTLTSSSDNISERNVEMSANPFSYQVAAPKGKAFSHVGDWFWDNYDAQVSVKPQGRGAVGLAVYVQDAANYIALLWSATEGPEARRLVRVLNGVPTVLAKQSGAFLPRQWYRLSVRTSPGYIQAFIDGTSIFQVRNAWFGQGRIGLIAQNVSSAGFDDVRVQSFSSYRQDFSRPLNNAWLPQGGLWRAGNGVLTSSETPGDAGKARLLLAGRSDWSGFQMSALVKTGPSDAAGLVASYRDAKNYALFRWAGPQSSLPFKGRQQLVRIVNGQPSVVSDEPLRLTAQANRDGYVPLKVRAARGALTVVAGDDVVAQTADETLGAGQSGLWAQGSGAVSFREVDIFFPPTPLAPKIAPRMEDDALMVGWASPSGEWPVFYTTSGNEYWNTGDFFGDSAVEYSWPRVASLPKMEVSLRAQRGDFGSGCIVACEQLEGKSGLRFSLSQGGQVLKQAEFKWKQLEAATSTSDGVGDNDGIPLRIALEGRALMVSVGGKPVLSYLSGVGSAKTLPAGTCFAVRARPSSFSARRLRVFSARRDDYTFTEAPIDWYAPQGEWSVFSRWPCYSDWSFFGGKGVNPVLWSKRRYAGDTVVEIYAHNQMDLPKEIGYSNPGNLNITIGGDGKNPASGYSFVVAGWHNTRTRILKGTRVLAENGGEDARFIRPINQNFAFHKRWFYIRAEVRRATKNGQSGALVSLSLDDVPIGEYFDPTPLPSLEQGGRVAFWTVDSTIMIARAKIESARFGARAVPRDLVDPLNIAAPTAPTTAAPAAGALVPRPVVSDGLPSAIVQADVPQTQSLGGWTIKNPAAGGIFAIHFARPNAALGKIGRGARLEMDVRLPPKVKVDAYITVNGTLHLIALTPQGRPDARAPLLGEAGGAVGADGWRHVSFAVGEALQKIDPGAPGWTVEDISLGALHGDEYRWLGFDGNALNASYQVRKVRLSGAAALPSGALAQSPAAPAH